MVLAGQNHTDADVVSLAPFENAVGVVPLQPNTGLMEAAVTKVTRLDAQSVSTSGLTDALRIGSKPHAGVVMAPTVAHLTSATCPRRSPLVTVVAPVAKPVIAAISIGAIDASGAIGDGS